MGEARGREGLLFGALARRNCPALWHATADRLLRGFRGDRQCSRHRRSIQRATNANLTPNHVPANVRFCPKADIQTEKLRSLLVLSKPNPENVVRRKPISSEVTDQSDVPLG